MIEYVLQGRACSGAVPTQTTVIAERFFDRGRRDAVGDPRAVWREDQQGCGGFRYENVSVWDSILNCRLRRPITD